MKELTLREIQLASLEILKKYADICEKNGFKYFLTFGTMLGAVRHKGFIPWDDDVDVMMPRKDYNKFIEYCKNNREDLKPFELMHYSTNRKYIYPISRLNDSRYHADYNNAKEYGLGTFIDIYPLDGCGSDQKDIMRIYKKMKPMRAIAYSSGLKKNEKRETDGAVFAFIRLLSFYFARLIGPHRLCEAIDKKAQKTDYEKSRYSACTVWSDCSKYSLDTALLEETVFTDFEGEKFRIPKEYDAILTKVYGNYMELPPESERVGHHVYKIYKK